jgi:hypothetical protein
MSAKKTIKRVRGPIIDYIEYSLRWLSVALQLFRVIQEGFRYG